MAPTGAVIPLPKPRIDGGLSLTESMAHRRSVRHFTPDPVGLDDLAQLLWAAQGGSGVDKHGPMRTAPSAGRTFPLEVYAATPDGVFRYRQADHALEVIGRQDVRSALANAAFDQECVRSASLVLAIAAVVARTTGLYEGKAERYVYLEAGHAAQNVLLRVTALGLGAVPAGSFEEAGVRQALTLPPDHTPIYLIPVGHPEER